MLTVNSVIIAGVLQSSLREAAPKCSGTAEHPALCPWVYGKPYGYKECNDWCIKTCEHRDLTVDAFGVCQCDNVLGPLKEKRTLGLCTYPLKNVSQPCQDNMPAFTAFDLAKKNER